MSSTRSKSPASDMDEEELFAQLEAEIENDENAAVREAGMAQFKKEMEQLKKLKESGHGRYDEIQDEKLVLQTTINEPLCVVHFYHNNFRRCKIMDQHLAKIAPKYFQTRFLRVFVENVPFLVTKLGIKVLPAVLIFIKGVSKDRIVGFEELGNEDKFPTSVLEKRLLKSGVIKSEQQELNPGVTYGSASNVRTHIRGGGSNSNANDDFDFDL